MEEQLKWDGHILNIRTKFKSDLKKEEEQMIFLHLKNRRGRWPPAIIDLTELFPAPLEKYSGLLTARVLDNCILQYIIMSIGY